MPFDRLEREPEQARARGEEGAIAGEDEFARPVEEGRGEREFRSDAGRLAGRDDDSPRRQGFLIST
jgi:hypothetical protein